MSKGQSKFRVILAGLDRRVLVERVNPALCRTGRFEVTATATTPDDVLQATVPGYIHLVIVEANIVSDLDEAIVLLGELSKKVRLVVIVPRKWEKHRAKFSALPDDVMILVAPVNWNTAAGSILDHLGLERVVEAQEQAKVVAADEPQGESRPEKRQSGDVSTDTSTDGSPPVQIHLRGVGPTVRIGFYGAKGGVGTSSAALTAARILAGEKRRVALFDATKRGDLHVMAEIQPVEQPLSHGAITFFLASPTEEMARDFDAIVVDGGRTRGKFNAEWYVVSKPLTEEKIAQLVGVKPPESEREQVVEKDDSGRKRTKKPREKKPKTKKPGGGFSLGDLISIEVTE